MTKTVNINETNDAIVSHLRRIKPELKGLYMDETKVNKALGICTKQEFRVIQIRKSINSFLTENFPEEELICLNLATSSETSNSAVGSVPEGFQNSLDVSQNPEIHASS